MSRILGGLGKRACGRVRVGAPDPSLTGTGGLIAVTELLDRLDVIGLLDVAVGPIKQRDRGFGAGELLVGMASAQLAGQDFLVGLDRVRADTAGQALSPVPGLAATTARTCRNTLQGLVGSSISCPRVDGHLFQTYLSHFVRSGLLRAPQQGGIPGSPPGAAPAIS